MKYLPGLLVGLIFFGCQTKDQTAVAVSNKKIDYQGHRGARGLYPENSIIGLIKALDYPIQTLELDLVVSKDSQLILSHEPWFSNQICSHPDGRAIAEEEAENLLVYELDYKDIKAYDCGLRGNPRFEAQRKVAGYKPSFMDAVSNVELYCRKQDRALPHYNVELKSRPEWYGKRVPPPATFVRLALDEINLLDIKNRVTLQSFDPAILNEIHRRDSNVTTSFLVENIESVPTNLAKLDFKPDIYSPYFKLLNIGVVQSLHDQGIKVIPWTINDPTIMQKLIGIGVDGIITDYPDRIR